MALSNLQWLGIARKLNPLIEPEPDTADEVDAWIERVRDPVMAKIKAEMKWMLGDGT